MKSQLSKIGFLLSLLLMGLVISANAQTKVTKDSTGNYVMVRAVAGGTPTGQTFMDSRGNKYPVMLSKQGKLYVIKTSRTTGNKYNFYIEIE